MSRGFCSQDIELVTGAYPPGGVNDCAHRHRQAIARLEPLKGRVEQDDVAEVAISCAG